MDKLSGLEVFVQTAVMESFVGAGRALGLSPSAVSKSISRLEERVGVRLFQRSTRSVRLTSEGQVFLERCRRIMGEIEVAENELSALAGNPRGRLRVSLPLAGGLPMPVVSAFTKEHPNIELDLDFSDRVVDVIDEGLDAVIRGSELSDSRLMSRKLGAYKVRLVASPEYLARRGEPSKPVDLLEHSCLHYRYPSTGKLAAWPVRQSKGALGELLLPQTTVVNSLEALLYLAQDGCGIACVPDFSVREAVSTGILTTVLDKSMTNTTTFWILWPSSKQMTPKVRVFVDFVVEHFKRGLVT
jgi:DNA-binding transcriptional LysR family regulator